MANNVFANGREISCKKADGKTICAFPDICMTPPVTGVTPNGVPIPYPNTGMAKDTANGSRTVKISGNEIIKKNVSYFKTSYGDEAGCATPAKKGIITGTIQGKVYFTSWSMDVKVESKNVARHLDTTTHNHGSNPNETIPWIDLDTSAFGTPSECDKEVKRQNKACENAELEITRTKKEIKSGKNVGKMRTETTYEMNCEDSPDCAKYQACILVPKKHDKRRCCAPNNTGHHMIEDHWVKGNSNFPMAQKDTKPSGYNAAPTACASNSRYEGTHGVMHDVQGVFEESYMEGGAREGEVFDYEGAKEATLWAHLEAHPDSKCSDECLAAQLDSFYGKDNDERPMNEPDTQGISGDREELNYVYSDVFDNP